MNDTRKTWALKDGNFDLRANKHAGGVAENARRLVESNLIGLSLDIGTSEQDWATRWGQYRADEFKAYQNKILGEYPHMSDMNMAWRLMRTFKLKTEPDNPDQWYADYPPQQDYAVGRENFKRNYMLVQPYDKTTPCQYFVHGREIFPTHEAYEAYVANGKRLGDIPPELMQRLLPIYLPGTTYQRLSAFQLVAFTPKEQMQLAIEEMKGDPADFPLLMSGKPPAQMLADDSTNAAIMEEFKRLTELGERAGHHLGKELSGRGDEDAAQKIIAQLEPNFRKRFAEMDERITKAAASNPGLDGYFHFKDQILEYAATKYWDWEIIDNFSKAIRDGIPYEGVDLETYLYQGAQHRVKFLIESQVRGLHDPYDPEFVKAEQDMAKCIAQAVVTPRIDKALKERTAILHTNGPNFDSFGVERYKGIAFGGKFDFPLAGFYGLQPFVYSTHHMMRGGTNLLLAHEFAHNDIIDNLNFVTRFDYMLEKAIQRDAEKFEAFEEWVKSVPLPKDVPLMMHSEYQPRWDELRQIAKKRGLNVELIDHLPLEERMPLLKNAIMSEIEMIRHDLLVFMPQLKRPGDENISNNIEGAYLDNFYARNNEIPAVVSHLTRCHGGDLVNRILPELSEMVNFHFADLLKYEMPEQGQNAR